MDEEVAQLVREQRLLAAAELASARGDARTASSLYERACEWRRAAIEALRSGDPGRALTLAVEGRDEDTAYEAVPRVAAIASMSAKVALQLASRGDHEWSARVHEASGRALEAAQAWERAGYAEKAAELFESARDPAQAARVLETAMRREPSRWTLHCALGSLLLRYGKIEAAIRVLQKVPAGASSRRRALTSLVEALERHELRQAADEARTELSALGGALEEAPRPAKAQVTQRLFGRYEINREIASTPTARVVECTDVVRGERVAVKLFSGYDARGAGRDALARFEREVRVLGAIEHPNVVPLRDYVADGPALVMAWMGGGDLEDRLARETLTPARAVEIASAILAALGESHRLGVLHRDIKPANVLFDDAGVTRLGDFGVAHLGDLSATATAGVIGTLAYMSPEQREGRPATIASDLYGVGALLREMLTGDKPSASEASRTLPSAVHRDLDARHDAVVLSLVKDSASERPEDAFAARRALTALRWPNVVERVAPRPAQERAASEHPASGRLETTLQGTLVDTWTARAIERIAVSDRSYARATLFARADDSALQTVLRVDREGDAIWLEALDGVPLDRPLSVAERRMLAQALDALHAAGGAHGAVDRDHIAMCPSRGLVLRFSLECPVTVTNDLDRAALARL